VIVAFYFQLEKLMLCHFGNYHIPKLFWNQNDQV